MRVLLPVRQESNVLASTFHPVYNPMIRKLESVFTLTNDERQALENLPMQVTVIKADQDIVREGGSSLPVVPDPRRLCLYVQDDRARQAPDRVLQPSW